MFDSFLGCRLATLFYPEYFCLLLLTPALGRDESFVCAEMTHRVSRPVQVSSPRARYSSVVLPPEVPCHSYLSFSSFFLSSFSSFPLFFNIFPYEQGETCSQLNPTFDIKESEMSTPKTNSEAKLNATQARTAELRAKVIAKFLQLRDEEWRIWAPTDENRAKLERMQKSNAFYYGECLRTGKDGRVFPFEAFTHMVTPAYDKEETCFEDWLDEEETYDGPTHLDGHVSFKVFEFILKRQLNGTVGKNRVADDKARLAMVTTVWQMLRHIETASFWQDQGFDQVTGAPYEYRWPQETKLFKESYLTLKRELRDPEDIREHNRFGRKWGADPLKEDVNFDDPNDNPGDNARARNRKFNDHDRTLPQFLC